MDQPERGVCLGMRVTNGKHVGDSPDALPGVYFEEDTRSRPAEIVTGVPAFLSFSQMTDTHSEDSDQFFKPRMLTGWKKRFGKRADAVTQTFVDDAVHGFFENGG